ncbi:MAG TPA: thiamine phosphate synthase [Acidobacteriaceae bacterium]|jgi:thiamine-phosphate pyrophosphorylase|nr:thiamine phosphate synthase [Acidobacteriaceae bacterium]
MERARFPRLYPILDAELVLRGGAAEPEQRRKRLQDLVRELAEAGVEILQYRNKVDADAMVLDDARGMKEAADQIMGVSIRLILNDRATLVAEAGWDGVHVGQEDLSAGQARLLVGNGVVGLSTHNDAQLMPADDAPVDYIAIGPVFTTMSKANPDPVIGLEGVRRARELTTKPLVAIGGITRETAESVYEAGADSIAVIGAIFGSGRSVREAAKDFLANFK